jgi:hypothetical protein
MNGSTEWAEWLTGKDCPECDREMDMFSLRWNGQNWEHRSEHPQGGHHEFDRSDVEE